MRLISLCLIATLITGCAGTRQLRFDSKPTGATVRLAGATCTTPCELETGDDRVQFAQISLAGRGEKVVRIEGRRSVSTRVGYGLSTATATTLKYISIPLLGVGLVGLILLSGNETDSFSNRDYQYDSFGFYITMGALASGGALALVANGMENVSTDLKPQEDVFVVLDVPEETNRAYRSPLTFEDVVGGKLSPVTVKELNQALPDAGP